MPSFSERLLAIRTELGSLCIGIDPSEEALTDWGIPDTAEGARDFGYAIISACTNRVGIVKPQVAFFERFGSTGYFALEEVLSAARESNLLIISDAKRGDIGATMLGYAQAWFGDDSPLRSDALTVSPYLGPSSLSETVEIARDVQGGVFVLAATSNVEAEEVQRAKTGSQSIAARVVRAAQELSDGDVGIVLGATQELSRFGVGSIREKDAAIPILAPGFGFQGAQLSNISDLFGASAQNVIPTLSRGLYQAGPNGIVQAIEALRRQL